jgi:hypothetical protein
MEPSFSIFFNNRIVSDDPFRLDDVPVAFGDFFLTPVRCLFNGNKVTLKTKNNVITVDHEKEYFDHSSPSSWLKPKRNFLRVIASIIFLIPGLILGSIFKGIGFLSESIRERHRLTIEHYTSIDREIGDENNRLDLATLTNRLREEKQNNHLNQPTKNLIVYAQPGTDLNTDPGLLDLNPQKIILVGAKIVHKSCAGYRLDDTLACNPDWESGKMRVVKLNHPQPNFSTFVTQRKVNTVDEARDDVPPRKSFFSFERYKRIYVI